MPIDSHSPQPHLAATMPFIADHLITAMGSDHG